MNYKNLINKYSSIAACTKYGEVATRWGYEHKHNLYCDFNVCIKILMTRDIQ